MKLSVAFDHAEKSIAKSNQLNAQIQATYDSKNFIEIIQSYTSLRAFTPSEIQDFKNKRVTDLQNCPPRTPYTTVQVRFTLNNHDFVDDYYGPCKVAKNYPMTLQDMTTLDRLSKFNSLSLKSIQTIFSLYKEHYERIKTEFVQSNTTKNNSVLVLLQNLTAVEEFFETFSGYWDTGNLQRELDQEPLQKVNIFGHEYNEIRKKEPDDCISVDEIYDVIKSINRQNMAYLAYIQNMNKRVVILKDLCYLEELEVMSMRHLYSDLNYKNERIVVQTKMVQLGQVIVASGIARWKRTIGCNLCTSFCEGKRGQKISSSFSTEYDMAVLSKNIQSCCDNFSSEWDNTKKGLLFATKLHGHVAKLNSALLYVSKKLNIDLYANNY